MDTTVLPETGTYKFRLDPWGPGIGSLTVQAWSVPDDVDGGSFLIDGPGKTLTIPNLGQNGWMTFEGTAGQRIQLQTSGSTFGGSSDNFQLLKPSGGVLWSHKSNQLMDTTVLPETGTYKFWLDPWGPGIGSLTVQAWSVPPDLDGGSALVDGAAVLLDIPNRGQNGWVTFDGVAGQRIQLQTSGSTFPSSTARFDVLKPSGAQLWGQQTGDRLVGAAVLPETGTYRFRLDPWGPAIGSISVRVWVAP